MTSALGRDIVTPKAVVLIEAVKDSVTSDKTSLTIVNSGLANVVLEFNVKVLLDPEKSTFSARMSSFSCT